MVFVRVGDRVAVLQQRRDEDTCVCGCVYIVVGGGTAATHLVRVADRVEVDVRVAERVLVLLIEGGRGGGHDGAAR